MNIMNIIHQLPKELCVAVIQQRDICVGDYINMSWDSQRYISACS